MKSHSSSQRIESKMAGELEVGANLLISVLSRLLARLRIEETTRVVGRDMREAAPIETGDGGDMGTPPQFDP